MSKAAAWALSSAALAALRKRADAAAAIDKVLLHCEYYSPWAMYFALELLADAKPRLRSEHRPLTPRNGGSTIGGCRIFSATTFLIARRAKSRRRLAVRLPVVERLPQPSFGVFLPTSRIPTQPRAVKGLDDTPPVLDITPSQSSKTLNSVGRYWDDMYTDGLIEPKNAAQAVYCSCCCWGWIRPMPALCSFPRASRWSEGDFLPAAAERAGSALSSWNNVRSRRRQCRAGQVYIRRKRESVSAR